MKKGLSFLFILIFHVSFGQNESLINQLQYGATVKAKFEFSPNSKNEPCIIFKVSVSGGIGSNWLVNELYPTINGEIQFYNGGLGSRSDIGNRYQTVDFILALTLSAGHVHSSFLNSNNLTSRNVPLRYFADFTIPALQNPYNYSISLGTNLIFTLDKGRYFQRLGFLNVNHSRFQFSYYNDGTPFQYVLLGDYYDRYYTGGGVLSYDGDFGNLDQLKSYHFEISYHKFSGFNKNSFELANLINASNVDYLTEEQQYYNKSQWRFNLQSSNFDNGFGFATTFYNSVHFDGQHYIHWLINNAYHLVPYKNYVTYEPSGIFLSNNFLK